MRLVEEVYWYLKELGDKHEAGLGSDYADDLDGIGVERIVWPYDYLMGSSGSMEGEVKSLA